MNTTWKFESEADPELLAEIKAIRASIGDGLNDDELTRLLREPPLPVQAGFAFRSFSEGMVTLSVPPQDLEKRYPEVGWIHPAKEMLARSRARKYDLALFEPPDSNHSCLSPHSGSPKRHHHIELAKGTVIDPCSAPALSQVPAPSRSPDRLGYGPLPVSEQSMNHPQ